MEQEQHLSGIATQWSIVRRAHNGDGNDRLNAQRALLERYGGAVRRYLVASLRDTDAADEVFQDFALRFVRGDFHRVDPDQGKFRGFLKTVIGRMIIDYHRGKQRRRQREPQMPEDFPSAVAPNPSTADADDQFVTSWREDVLARCWEQLRRAEATSGRPLFTVLRHRVEHPQDSSQALAEQLSARFGRPLTAGNVRVMVHRARDKFAALLLKEVADSLEDDSVEQLEQELIELRLHDYCRDALVPLRDAAAGRG
jgi:RNA polymerase sigma-70 factor (ECF subfamily)